MKHFPWLRPRFFGTLAKCSGARSAQRGAALFLTFLMLFLVAGLGMAIAVFAQHSQAASRSALLDQQAYYIAEAGWQRARQALVAGTWSAATSPGNTYTESFGAGEYRVTAVDNGSSTYTITSEGYVPNQTATAAKRRLVESSIGVNTTSTNQSLTATASASSSQGGSTPDKSNDGSTGTTWRADTTGSNEWLAMDYGSARDINSLVVIERENIDGMTVEISCNGSSWTVVPGLSVLESPALTWTATFPTVRERYLRARFTSVPSGQRARVEELRTFSPRLGTGTLTTTW